jgi:predicted deacetylase
MTRPPALLSIHDVMPETLEEVGALLDLIDAAGLRLPALLVVPGRDWSAADVDRLRLWETAGCEILAHGWLHRTTPQRPYHRLHSLLLSRDVAEHLALEPSGVAALMRRSREWFPQVGLPAPDTYVPPAWALGMPRRQLGALPFTCVETLRGVHLRGADAEMHFRPLPLVGFEADSALRASTLALWNRVQRALATTRRTPLRIGIHPRDDRLRLGASIIEL